MIFVLLPEKFTCNDTASAIAGPGNLEFAVKEGESDHQNSCSELKQFQQQQSEVVQYFNLETGP